MNDLLQLETFEGGTLKDVKARANNWMVTAWKNKWEIQQLVIFPPQSTMKPRWCITIYYAMQYVQSANGLAKTP